MMLRPNPFKSFVHRTEGAVTVEYVMLAAGVLAAGLIASGILSDGFRSLAGTVDGELSGTPVEQVVGIQYSDGFDHGAGGWNGAGVLPENHPLNNGLGNVLGPIENTGGLPSVNRDFEIDPNASQATFEFDLYSVDNLDGDSGIVFVGGEEVGRVTVNDGVPAFTASEGLDERGVTIRFTELDNDVPLGGNPNQNDAKSNIFISVDNPDENVNIGFGSDASAGADNEFFAIDNFRATGLADG